MKRHELNLRVLDNAVKQGKLSVDDATDIKEQRKQFESEEIFLRKRLAGTNGVIEVIDENDVQKNCVTNLSKGSIPKEKNIIVDKVGIRFGYSATDVSAASVNYSNAEFDLANLVADEVTGGMMTTESPVYARRIPIQIRNAEYVMTVDGVVMDSGRVCDLLTNNVSSDATNGDAKNFKQLEYPKLFLADKRIRFDLKFPENGAPVPVGFYYIELVAKGLGLGKKA
jgi:hypothetical protein